MYISMRLHRAGQFESSSPLQLVDRELDAPRFTDVHSPALTYSIRLPCSLPYALVGLPTTHAVCDWTTRRAEIPSKSFDRTQNTCMRGNGYRRWTLDICIYTYTCDTRHMQYEKDHNCHHSQTLTLKLHKTTCIHSRHNHLGPCQD